MTYSWIDTATGFYIGMGFGMLVIIGAIYLGILFKEDNLGR